nr:AMP-binding protein [Streptomyces sp. NBC_00830]WTB35747.1 AMP-binding protein [Streptomyces sp. NBC_00830]
MLQTRFLRGLARNPDGTALRVGAQTTTYTGLHDLALTWGGTLTQARARTVAVLAGKNLTGYAGLLAALYAGATVVPVRPDFPLSRIRRTLDAARPDTVIADDEGLNVLDRLATPLPVLAPHASRDPAHPLRADRAGRLTEPVPVRADDRAYLLFTSGSTGRPKGVVLTHGNVDYYFGLLDQRYDFQPGDVFSQTFDLNFDCAMFDLFAAWGAGAEVCAVPPMAYRELPDFLAQRGITVWFSTPSAVDVVRRMSGLAPGALPTLRHSFFAGEALTCRDAADWQRAAPTSTVENLYGPTELTVTVAAYRWAGTATERIAVNGMVPIGRVHAGHEELLLGDDGQPADTEGELCVAGPQLTPGYLDPADAAGRFLDHDGLTYYRTGDRVRRLPGAQLAYLGRLDSQVQIRGIRVELAEVENALRDCGITDVVTVTVQRTGTTELFTFYTGPHRPAAGLVRALRGVLQAAIIPRHFHHVDAFPLNTNRKIDRKLLAETAQRIVDGIPAEPVPAR